MSLGRREVRVRVRHAMQHHIGVTGLVRSYVALLAWRGCACALSNLRALHRMMMTSSIRVGPTIHRTCTTKRRPKLIATSRQTDQARGEPDKPGIAIPFFLKKNYLLQKHLCQ